MTVNAAAASKINQNQSPPGAFHDFFQMFFGSSFILNSSGENFPAALAAWTRRDGFGRLGFTRCSLANEFRKQAFLRLEHAAHLWRGHGCEPRFVGGSGFVGSEI